MTYAATSGGMIDGKEAFYPTKTGFRCLEREFRRVVRALMPETYVHPLIVKSSFRLLSSGEFESAVLKTFKIIERASGRRRRPVRTNSA